MTCLSLFTWKSFLSVFCIQDLLEEVLGSEILRADCLHIRIARFVEYNRYNIGLVNSQNICKSNIGYPDLFCSDICLKWQETDDESVKLQRMLLEQQEWFQTLFRNQDNNRNVLKSWTL